METTLLTSKEAAQILRVNPRTLVTLAGRGLLRPVALGPSIRRWRAGEIHALARGEIPAAAGGVGVEVATAGPTTPALTA